MDITPDQFEEIYSIASLVGEGNFGKYSRVCNIKESFSYALKVTKLPDEKELKKNILVETDFIRRLGHDNILQFFHFSVIKRGSDDYLYKVSELGTQSLQQWIIERNQCCSPAIDRVLMYNWIQIIGNTLIRLA